MINLTYQDFIPNIIFVLIFSFMGSILHIRILSCHIQQLLHSKPFMLLALFIIVFIGVYSHKQILTQENIEVFNNTKIRETKIEIFGKLIILSLFYFILILMIFKIPKFTFIICSLIFIVNISLSFIEFNNDTYLKYNKMLETVNFGLSIFMYILIIAGHIYYIGLEKIELGKQFNLFKLYTTIGSCHYSNNTLNTKMLDVFLTALNLK